MYINYNILIILNVIKLHTQNSILTANFEKNMLLHVFQTKLKYIELLKHKKNKYYKVNNKIKCYNHCEQRPSNDSVRRGKKPHFSH